MLYLVDYGLFIATNAFYLYVEAKSVTIRRMQSNLEVWEGKLKEVYEKKKENGKSLQFQYNRPYDCNNR